MTTTEGHDGLTQRQREVVRYIYEHAVRRGRPPSIKEIGTAMGIRNKNGVVCHLKALRSKSWLDWSFDTTCGIRLAGVAFVPLFGADEAGNVWRDC